jgi:hydroxymethylpyrimidine pyrophosphatase-like HAD family hydrolase
VSFAKILCIRPRVPLARLADAIDGPVAALPSSITSLGERVGELYLADVHKAVGMQVVVEALGKRPSDVVAVGDGLNDLEMLDYAGLAVAIEGADERVLAAADRTAPPPERNGLALLFAELGLL